MHMQAKTWRDYLLPLVHDLTGLLYSAHMLPLLGDYLVSESQ